MAWRIHEHVLRGKIEWHYLYVAPERVQPAMSP